MRFTRLILTLLVNAGLVLLFPFVGLSGGVVTNCTEMDLRTAMQGGGTVTFACNGTIILANTISTTADVVLDGSGRQVTISGGTAVRVFYVSTGTTLTLIRLTVRDGRTPDGANAVWTPSGPTPGSPGEPGGGLYNAGTLIMRDCVVTANRTGNGGSGYSGPYGSYQYSAGGPGGPGGGIYNAGTLMLSNCIVSANSTGNGGVSGVDGGPAYDSITSGAGGNGAGIYNAGALRLDDSTVCSNSTGNGADTPTRYDGAKGGAGAGIWSGGTLSASGCTFSGNSTGHGGVGGAGNNPFQAPTGGVGGAGGGICSTGTLALTNCTLAGNATGPGGSGGSGSYYGGGGGSGGSGAGIHSQNLFLLNCTIATNRAGNGGLGGYGSSGWGPSGSAGYGGGLGKTSGSAQLLNTLVALNTGNGQDVSGAFISLGHNLIGATNGSSGFPTAGDLVGSSAAPLDPKLGPLADNSGPTLTMALLPGSPAIDAGDTAAAPLTDQRGFPRPIGSAADMGAYEYGSPALLQISGSSLSQVGILVYGPQGQFCRLLVSTDLVNWVSIGTNQLATNGTATFYDSGNHSYTCRFYRIALP